METKEERDFWEHMEELARISSEADLRRPIEELDEFENNQKKLLAYIEESIQLINDKATSIDDLEKRRHSLKNLANKLQLIYKRMYVYKTQDAQYVANPALNEDQRKLFEQAIDELTTLAKAAKGAIEYRTIAYEQLPIQNTLEDLIRNKENLFCPAMPLEEAIKFFAPLVIKQKSNKPPHLDIEQFKAFIRRAFLKEDDVDKIQMNLLKGDKFLVIKRFRQFYDMSIANYESIDTSQEKYLNLLTTNFSNPPLQIIKGEFRTRYAKGEMKELTEKEWEMALKK